MFYRFFSAVLLVYSFITVDAALRVTQKYLSMFPGSKAPLSSYTATVPSSSLQHCVLASQSSVATYEDGVCKVVDITGVQKLVMEACAGCTATVVPSE